MSAGLNIFSLLSLNLVSKSPIVLAASSVTTVEGKDAVEDIVLVESSVLFDKVCAKLKTANVSVPVIKGNVIFLSAVIAEGTKTYLKVLAGLAICSLPFLNFQSPLISTSSTSIPENRSEILSTSLQ